MQILVVVTINDCYYYYYVIYLVSTVSALYVSFASLMPQDTDPRFVHLLADFFGWWGGKSLHWKKPGADVTSPELHERRRAPLQCASRAQHIQSYCQPRTGSTDHFSIHIFQHPPTAQTKRGEENNYTFLPFDFLRNLRNKPIFDHKVSLIVFLSCGVRNLRSLAITVGYHSLTYVQRSFD